MDDFNYFYPVKAADVLYPNYTEEGFGFGSKEEDKKFVIWY